MKEKRGKEFVAISLHEGQVYKLIHTALVSKCASRKCLIHTRTTYKTPMVAVIRSP